MGLPASDVLYFELDGGNWMCVRPSGTEPKVKLYINTVSTSQAGADDLASRIGADAKALLQ